MTTTILVGDAVDQLRTLPDASVHCCVTSPPYWNLRDYGVDGQIGLEDTPEAFVDRLVAVFREVRRVLRDDGTAWVNLGDTYAGGGTGARNATRWPKQSRNAHMPRRAKTGTGLKYKDLVGIPWMVAFALRHDGWHLRADIIWSKPNPMPESVGDRPTKSHEHIFLLSKSETYFYDEPAIREPAVSPRRSGPSTKYSEALAAGDERHRTKANLSAIDASGHRQRRDVWSVASHPFEGAHFATMPPKLVEPCILAGCPVGGVVLDCFGGAGTTAVVAEHNRRDSILIELNPAYADIARQRIDEATAQQRLF